MAMASKPLMVFCAAGAHVHAIKMKTQSSYSSTSPSTTTYSNEVVNQTMYWQIYVMRVQKCIELSNCNDSQKRAAIENEICNLDLWFDQSICFPAVAKWVHANRFQGHQRAHVLALASRLVTLASHLVTRQKPEKFPLVTVSGVGEMEIRSIVSPDTIHLIPRYQQHIANLSEALCCAQKEEFPFLFVAVAVGSSLIDCRVEFISSSNIEAVDSECLKVWKFNQMAQLKQREEELQRDIKTFQDQITPEKLQSDAMAQLEQRHEELQRDIKTFQDQITQEKLQSDAKIGLQQEMYNDQDILDYICDNNESQQSSSRKQSFEFPLQ